MFEAFVLCKSSFSPSIIASCECSSSLLIHPDNVFFFELYQVKMANDCIGEEVEKLVSQLSDGGVLLLENVRFYKEEEKNDPEFAKKLASLADLYVNDAFGTAHRAHASTEGVTKFLKPSVAGFLMQKVCLFCILI